MNNNKISNVKKNLKKEYEEKFLEKNDIFLSKKASFKKYQKPIINSINQIAGGTKPSVVGQMSEIVPLFIDYCINNNIEIRSQSWKTWYKNHYPINFDKALQKVKIMTNNFKTAIKEINDEMINKWLNNFLFIENIEGLLIQYEIFNFLKKEFPNKKIRLATPYEESKNIDIIVDNVNYQVKPLSIKQGTAFQQKWDNQFAIWYKKAIKNKKEIYKFYLPKEIYKK